MKAIHFILHPSSFILLKAMDYSFTALNTRGAKITEQVEADTEEQAIRRLQSQGYVVLSVTAAGGRKAARAAAASAAGSRPRFSFSRRVKFDQVAMLTRELAIMIETGVAITEALESLEAHADSPTIQEALAAARTDLAGGMTMSQAFGAHPRVFPKLYVDMVRTAETGGALDETLNQAADYLESALEMRRKVSGALTYPVVLLFVAVVVVTFMMTYLIPQFSQLFARMNADIPPSTKFLLSASAFLRAHWWLIPASLVGSVLGLRALLRLPAGKEALTHLLHRAPVLGDVVKKVAMARILRALGTLMGTGVSLLIALETAAQTAQNVVFEKAMMRLRQEVEEGAALSDAVKNTGVFPAMVCQMMAVGEKSGRLNNVLLRVSQFYERDVDARLKMLTSILEPVMIVLLGLIVGFIAVSIITPIYSLVGSVK